MNGILKAPGIPEDLTVHYGLAKLCNKRVRFVQCSYTVLWLHHVFVKEPAPHWLQNYELVHIWGPQENGELMTEWVVVE